MKRFTVGDVVRLASGGPRMTVTGDGDDPGYVECEWFDEGDVNCRDFREDALVKDDRPSGPAPG